MSVEIGGDDDESRDEDDVFRRRYGWLLELLLSIESDGGVKVMEEASNATEYPSLAFQLMRDAILSAIAMHCIADEINAVTATIVTIMNA